jgi:hypothetical protein
MLILMYLIIMLFALQYDDDDDVYLNKLLQYECGWEDRDGRFG